MAECGVIRRRLLASIVLLIAWATPSSADDALNRRIAVTYDDLPWVQLDALAPSRVAELTARLLAAHRDAGVPVVGFVNEARLFEGARLRPDRVDLLKAWLAAGYELGNHTASHPSLNAVPVEAWIADVDRGARLTPTLARKAGLPWRYFRHPYLHTGRTAEVRAAADAALAARGYTVAPVSIDNGEWIFALAYRKAGQAGDRRDQRQLRTVYLDYMLAKVAYFEQQSVKLFGRNVDHILLLHANDLNADAAPALYAALRDRGYAFVRLEQALADPAYRSPDTFYGAGGISWLHRFAYTRGERGAFFAGEPTVPAWVLDFAGVASE